MIDRRESLPADLYHERNQTPRKSYPNIHVQHVNERNNRTSIRVKEKFSKILFQEF